jgi:hypothetical protein
MTGGKTRTRRMAGVRRGRLFNPGQGTEAGTQDWTMARWSGPTVALRNPAARNGPPAAAKVETLAATVAKNGRENAPGVVLLLTSAIDTVP